MDSKLIFNVAKEFGTAPGPRYEHEGLFSGEVFRKNYLLPKFKNAISSKQKLVVLLDGTSGFGTSFLEEAFGGLIRYDGFRIEFLHQNLEMISKEEPYLLEEIEEYMQDASNENIQ